MTKLFLYSNIIQEMGDTMFDLNKINDCLSTKETGRTIIQYDTLSSTYLKAKNIFNTCPEGSVVLTENQTKWNVRMGKEWFCYPGKNIYLSIILKPLVNNHLISKYDIIGCSSVCEALKSLYKLDFRTKWPNDVVINGNKVFSVCSSLVSKNNRAEGVIISMGINVNMDKAELESNEEIKDTATSLLVEISREIDREVLIGEILNNIEKYYNELKNENSSSGAVSIFNENSVINNKSINVIKRGKRSIRKVYAREIDSEGWLAVTNDKGNEEILNPGETIIIYEKNA